MVSAALLACTLTIDPSWPVVIALAASAISAPRASPTMIRDGRKRRASRPRSSMLTRASCSFQAPGTVAMVIVFSCTIRPSGRSWARASSGAAGDDHVQPGANALAQEGGHAARDGAVGHELVECARPAHARDAQAGIDAVAPHRGGGDNNGDAHLSQRGR